MIDPCMSSACTGMANHLVSGHCSLPEVSRPRRLITSLPGGDGLSVSIYTTTIYANRASAAPAPALVICRRECRRQLAISAATQRRVHHGFQAISPSEVEHGFAVAHRVGISIIVYSTSRSSKRNNLWTADLCSVIRSRIIGLKNFLSTLSKIQLIDKYVPGTERRSWRLMEASISPRQHNVEFALHNADVERIAYASSSGKDLHSKGPEESGGDGDGDGGGLNLAEDDVHIIAQYMTRHNFVRVIEVLPTSDSQLAGTRFLLLDKPGNIHSIHQTRTLLTDAYYDLFATLPAIIPDGPIGIFGLGAGTAARLIHHFWPEVDVLHGWELDIGVVQAARKFFDLEELELEEGSTRQQEREVVQSRRKRNSRGRYSAWKDENDEIRSRIFQRSESAAAVRKLRGKLRVHVGDALGSDAVVDGGFAGLIVDLFSDGAVIPALQEVETWREMRRKLRPGGRIMINCGGSCVQAAGPDKVDGHVTMLKTVSALAEAFPGGLSINSLKDYGDNSMALTGLPPDFQAWEDTLPDCLRRGMENWRPFSLRNFDQLQQ